MKHLWRDLKYGVRNLVQWFPIIWRDRAWDHYFLTVMLEKKLSRMADLQENYGNGLHRMRYARQMRVAALTCKRLSEDVYDDAAEQRFPRPEGSQTWFEGARLCATPDPLLRARIDYSAALRKADRDRLGRLISKYLDHWWD